MINPLNMNHSIQQAPDVARFSLNENQTRPEVAAQQFADRLEKQTRQQQEQVVKNEAAEKNGVNPDRQGHGGGYDPKRNRTRKKSVLKKPLPQEQSNGESMYNILI